MLIYVYNHILYITGENVKYFDAIAKYNLQA